MGSSNMLLGTNNLAKQRKLRWLLEGLSLTLSTPGELGLAERTPAEEGHAHEENAQLKAADWSRLASMPAIASDGGLVIPALGQRWESLHTHRFAGAEADDQTRLERLLRVMEPYKGDERGASWVEALAVAQEGEILASWQVEGAMGVLLEDVGNGLVVPGFWVFSVWSFPQVGRTYNQLDEGELERLNDHWSQLQPLVHRYFRQQVADRG